MVSPPIDHGPELVLAAPRLKKRTIYVGNPLGSGPDIGAPILGANDEPCFLCHEHLDGKTV